MIRDALSVLRAEVQTDPTGRPNLIPNPSGERGGWFWTTPLRFTQVTGETGPVLRLTAETGATDCYTQSNPILCEAGDYIGARLDTVAGTAGHNIKIRFRFYDSNSQLLATSGPTGSLDVTTAATRYYAATQAPAGTTYARLKIDLFEGSNNPPDVPAYAEFANVMVTTDAVSFSSPYAFTEPAEYANILGPTSSVTITRPGLEPGVLGLRIIDTALDPAVSDALQTGRAFRITALNDDTATWDDLAGDYWIVRATVDYDLEKTPDKQAVITLTATDSLQLLSNTKRPNAVGTVAELPYVLETVGIPYDLDGETGNLSDDPTVTAVLDNATALDQVLLTRDRAQGYAWIDKSGTFTVRSDRNGDFYTGTVTLDESNYSTITPSFDTDDCINEVKVTRVYIDAATGETKETTYGPFRDEAAIAEWKVVRSATFRVTGLLVSNVDDYASQILTKNSQPRRRVVQVTIPINEPEHITTDLALIDLYAKVRILNTALGIDITQRVTSITHSIRATNRGVKWLMTLGFGFGTSDAVSAPAPVGGASGGSNIILSRRELRFHNTDEFTIATPGDALLELTHVPVDGSLHVRWGALTVPNESWSLDGNDLTILDPDDYLRSGDLITTAYAYDASSPAPTPSPGGSILNFEATGWKWLQIGRTDATDYSAAAFDDSAWATATAAFGDGGDMIDPALPAHTTLWQKTTRMWARRTLTGLAVGEDITGTIRADESSVIYLDGIQVWSGTPNGNEMAVTIDAADVTSSSMVLAVRTTDGSSSLGCYFDLELTQ